MVAHLRLKQNTREKGRWELLKDAACCFEQVLEAALHETAAIWQLTSHHTIQAIHAGHGWKSKDKSITDVLL